MIGLKAVKPHQSMEIDVKKLRDDQTPDFRGATIPINATSGQVKWTLHQHEMPSMSDRNKLALIGRSEQIDTIKGLSSSYACQNCCGGGDVGGFISADPTGQTNPPNNNYEFEVGEIVQYYAFLTHIDCYGHEAGYCQVTIPGSWNTDNPSITTINSTGLATITGVGNTRIRRNLEGYRSLDGFPCPPQLFTFNPNGEACKDEAKVEYPPNASNVIGCGECITRDTSFTATAGIFVKPIVILTVPATAKDGDTVSFSVAAEGGTPTNYQWSFTSPNGVGNNPQVNFTAPNAAITEAKANWFANPNQPCSTGTATSTDPYYNSKYKIKMKVTFNDGKTVEKDSPFTVNNYWSPSGYVQPPNLEGLPEIQRNLRGIWFVSGQGTLVRKTYAKLVYVPVTSQFYNKISKHEEKHEQQVSSGIASQLWVVSNFMNQISSLTDSTQAGLRTKLNNASLAWDNSQLAAWNALRTQAEQEAYAVSDPIAPQYAFQNCGRY